MSTYQYISDEFPANNIGKALKGVSTYVLDKQMRLLPARKGTARSDKSLCNSAAEG